MGNVQPIVLLFALQEILAICMIGRIGYKVDKMVEKAITSSDYSAILFMSDRSKAFDSIYRAIIMEDLRGIC